MSDYFGPRRPSSSTSRVGHRESSSSTARRRYHGRPGLRVWDGRFGPADGKRASRVHGDRAASIALKFSSIPLRLGAVLTSAKDV
jgi:hypothetical protein